MQIRWDNVVIVAMVCGLVLLIVERHSEVTFFLRQMENVTEGGTREEQFRGLIPFGLTMVLIASLAKILTRPERSD